LLVVVVGGVDIDNGMDKTEDEPFGGPVDDDVHGHVILIHGNLFHIRERCGSATET